MFCKIDQIPSTWIFSTCVPIDLAQVGPADRLLVNHSIGAPTTQIRTIPTQLLNYTLTATNYSGSWYDSFPLLLYIVDAETVRPGILAEVYRPGLTFTKGGGIPQAPDRLQQWYPSKCPYAFQTSIARLGTNSGANFNPVLLVRDSHAPVDETK